MLPSGPAAQPSPPTAESDPVAVARAAARIHPLEQALLVVTCVHLSFVPWALGTMHVWSQLTSLALSLTSFVLAVLPRRYPKRHVGGSPYLLHTFPELRRFPVFWIGGAFLAYVFVQGLNTTWEYVPTRAGFWLRGTPHVAWLPSGLRTPFAEASPWRSLVVYGSAWLAMCATWAGFTRRKTLRTLLGVLVANALLLAVLALLQWASHADKIFWSWEPPASYFVGSFIYRNHAGAYFGLLTSVACALALAYQTRREEADGRRGPGVFFAAVALVLTSIVLGANSRGAAVLLAAFFAMAGVTVVRAVLASGHPARRMAAGAIVATGLVAGLAVAVIVAKESSLGVRLPQLRREILDPARTVRMQVDAATVQLIGDAPALGWGAGSFRYVFPGYQARFPGILLAGDSGKRLRFEHAHNDCLELLAECGWLGAALPAAGLGCLLVALGRRGGGRNPLVSLLLPGCLLTCAHALFDFPFANPAILTTWCCLWPVMQRWLEIERLPTNRKTAVVARRPLPRPAA